MFKSKPHGDIVRKLSKKIVDLKKTSLDRFKYLKTLIAIGDGDGFPIESQKEFFEQNYQHAYHVFQDNFLWHIDPERRTKGQRVHKDDFEYLLIVFEKILTFLPNLLRRRWQFNSIRTLLKLLLHSGNTLKLRKDGVRLFIIWYQILQEHNDVENHQIFSKLVTIFQDSESYLSFSDFVSVPTSENPVTPVEIHPLIPAATSDKTSSKVHKFLMESVLTFMVSEVVKVQWDNLEMQELAFRFLFNSFKTYYLNVIFPKFDVNTSVYATSVDHLPEFGTEQSVVGADVLGDCQDVVIRWFTTFVQSSRSLSLPEANKEELPSHESTDLEQEGVGTLKEGDTATLDSKSGTLTNGSLDPVTTTPSKVEGMSMEESSVNVSQHDIVYKVLLGDRNNINIVHEIFRQAFMLPLTHAGAVRRVVLVYKDWLQVPEARPTFMQEPTAGPDSSLDEVDLAYKRTSFKSKAADDLKESIVQAGLQNSLILFIKHSAFVFMINPNKDSLSMQAQEFGVDLCRRVLNIYRYMVMNVELDNKTWEQLLVVLLKITSYILGQEDALLGKHLAASLLQTLIVSWIKANLCIQMSSHLWDQLLSVLSSLCQWEELIKEWAKTMETLTRVLAKQVYKLNLQDLPLDRLSEQKSKRQRWKQPSSSTAASKKATFSRAYSRFDSASNFRAQLLSRSTTEDSESTLADEFDEVDGAAKSSDEAPRKSRAFTEAIHSFSSQLTRSSSDSNLSGNLDKLKVGSTGTLVGADDKEDVPDDPAVQELSDGKDSAFTENIEKDSQISISINDTSCSTTSSKPPTHSTDKTGANTATAGVAFSIDTDMTEERDGAKAHRSRTPSESDSFVSATSHSRLKPRNDSSVSNNSRFSSEGGYSMMSESGEDTNSMISYGDASETSTIPIMSESRRSQSSSPTSNDLTQYLPDEISHFLKQDSMAADAAIYDNESLALKHTGSIDKEIITIEENYRSVLTGGQIPGWTPDVAVVLWRRMLGILGDVNGIKECKVHERVMEHLSDLQETLLKLSDNMNVSADNTSSQEPGEITSPIFYFFPICIKCLSLDEEYQASKIIALQMLAKMCLRFDYLKLPPTHLTHFYNILHKTLTSTETEYNKPLVATLVRHSTLLFGLDLPGSTLFIMDAINAVTAVLNLKSNHVVTVPRVEATTLLASLVSFPNHFGAIEVLSQSSSNSTIKADHFKDLVLAVLLDGGRKEPAGIARCVALSSLGIFLVEEMLSKNKHSKFRDTVNVLLVSLRFNTELVARVACDMLLLLSYFVPELTEYEPTFPAKIVSTIVASLHNHISQTSKEDNLHVVESIMFCLLQWCMNLSLDDLVKKDAQGASLIGKVFKILQVVSTGEVKKIQKANPEFSQEYDLESMMSVAACTNSPMKSLYHSSEEDEEAEESSVTAAAKFVMRHLVNLISNFPSDVNSSRTFTSLQECHDLDISATEMCKDIFDSPNLQMFVFNKSTLLTVMEMQKRDISWPIGSSTIPSSTARILVRDLTGRYSANATMIYENRQAGPTTIKRSFSHTNISENLFDSSECGVINNTINNPLPSSNDQLDKMLRHIAESSPECQLQPGEPLDVPVEMTDDVTSYLEEQVKTTAAQHEQVEINLSSEQKTDFRLTVGRERAPQYSPTTLPYTLCRQLLNQMGYLSWETRHRIHLLKKTEKLLRELKHLDMQSCRETHKFAVIYVANGQEDKHSILSNSTGSSSFEEFVCGLGWEVDLTTHEGFMGGLQKNKSNGATAPYYCTSTLEVMYHVSTRMPSETEEDRHKKLRHIGNDEIHVVWSEHYRTYRRGIIPTDFANVIIIIYPLECGLYRIQIDKKPEVPFFGPLFDGAIVSKKSLPVLIRCTAVNASRIHRLTLPHFKPFFQVRMVCLDRIVKVCRMDTTFETFTAGVYAPSLADQDYLPLAAASLETEQAVEADINDSSKSRDVAKKSWPFLRS